MAEDRPVEPRLLDLARDVLDLHIVDRDLRAVGRVDDIELGDADVTAFVSGIPALAGRFRGRFRAWMRGLYARLSDEKNAEPIHIPLSAVRHINSRVSLSVRRDEISEGKLDRWIVERVIGRIPGADHAPE